VDFNEEGTKIERFTRKIIMVFYDFCNILNVDEFCRMHSFKFLDLNLIKNLEITLVFLEFFISTF
jgi:hypothetical protein